MYVKLYPVCVILISIIVVVHIMAVDSADISLVLILTEQLAR